MIGLSTDRRGVIGASGIGHARGDSYSETPSECLKRTERHCSIQDLMTVCLFTSHLSCDFFSLSVINITIGFTL